MVFFSKAISIEIKVAVKIFLGVTEIREFECYLGLLVVVSRNKKGSLNYIKEREFGINSKGGKRSCYLKQVEKSC